MRRQNTEADFWKLVEKTPDCWLWNGHITKNDGYGRFEMGDRQAYAHRLAFEFSGGKIPAGMTIDHLCRNHLCVNPKHLEVVSIAENVRRGFSPSALNARKSECKRGHQLTGKNLRILPNGDRACRKCAALHAKAAYHGTTLAANAEVKK